MYTVYEDEEQLFKSLRAGADGYLLKRTPPARLLEAISDVHAGNSAMSSQIARLVVKHFHQLGPAWPERGNCQLVRHRVRHRALAPPQHLREVARALPDGGGGEISQPGSAL